jgi:hypothetical protein
MRNRKRLVTQIFNFAVVEIIFLLAVIVVVALFLYGIALSLHRFFRSVHLQFKVVVAWEWLSISLQFTIDCLTGHFFSTAAANLT